MSDPADTGLVEGIVTVGLGRVGGEAVGERRRFGVQVMNEGWGNGLHYSAGLLEQAAPLFEGATVLLDHASADERFGKTGNRSAQSVIGVLEWSRFDAAAAAVKAELRLYPGPRASWVAEVADQIVADRLAGRPAASLGLSAVLDIEASGKEVTRIRRVVSVDVVYDPARGGEFERVLNQQEGGTVEEQAEYKAVEVAAGGGEAEKAPAAEPEAKPAAVAAVPAEDWRIAELQARVAAMEVERLIGATKLAEPAKAGLRKLLDGCVDVEQAVSVITTMQQTLADVEEARGAVVSGAGASRVQVGLAEGDRLQAAMDRLCGLKLSSEALQGVPPVSGIRELYLMLSGDYDFRGVFDRDRVALANVTTSTMTSLVKNAFNKVVLDWWNQVDLWWRPVVFESDYTSMQDLTLITLGGFGDLPTVSEGAAYTELSWSDAEEVVAFVKKGAYIGVTLEMMDKDETAKFRAIPGKIARAGYRTLSAAVAALFSDNSGVGPYWPSSQSTYRLFDAQYSNLGSTALSAAAWDATIQAMFKQTEATSSKRMGIRPAFCLVPIELEKTALTIFESAGEPGTADNDANVRRGSARVIAVPDWTDTNDWAAVADPVMVPCVHVGYRFGNAPEIYTADDQVVGSMFTNDEMRIKARFIYAVGVGEYRGLYKHNVT